MTDVLADLEALIGKMPPADKAALDSLIAEELNARWLPNPGPQTDAYYSKADLTLYGGAAGGGKTDLLLGTALTTQNRAVIFRRAYVDLRGIEERLLEITGSRDGYNGADMVYRHSGKLLEFGALEKPGAEFSWQGRAHDFIGFDEGAQLSAAKVAFVLGWLRSTDAGQKCRAVIASNPPMGGEGEWLIEWFAPWLDPAYRNPAAPGELRWAYMEGNRTIWTDGPDPITIDGEVYTPLSRTFIPALLDDNPYLRDTGYRARVQSMPEPLRSQLLKGDFLAGREDDEWQVIPSSWVDAAVARWEATPQKTRPMLSLSADVALGGADDMAIARLHSDSWFAPLIAVPGKQIKDPVDIAALMLKYRRDNADLSVDGTGGWGSGVRSHLVNDSKLACESIVYSSGSLFKTKDGKLGFKNLRAQMYWQFREALDPESGSDVKLPSDPRLKAELITPRYAVRGTDILVESKEDIKKRIGGSTDKSDAVVMAWLRRDAYLRNVPKKPPKLPQMPTQGAWMGR